jgi:hypothetical protein
MAGASRAARSTDRDSHGRWFWRLVGPLKSSHSFLVDRKSSTERSRQSETNAESPKSTATTIKGRQATSLVGDIAAAPIEPAMMHHREEYCMCAQSAHPLVCFTIPASGASFSDARFHRQWRASRERRLMNGALSRRVSAQRESKNASKNG